jgi:endonuclease/exonuclease/phosphatase (EEP) superfamily protein YafD
MPKKGKKTRKLSLLLSIGFSTLGLIGSASILLNLHLFENWLGELLGLFGLQWAVLLLFFASLGFLQKQKLSGGLQLVLALWFLIPIGSSYVGSVEIEKIDDDTFRLLSYELGAAERNEEALLEFLYTENADLIYLQNLRLSDKQWLKELEVDYPYFKNLSREGGYGIALFSKNPWVNLQVVDFELPAHPSASLRMKLGNKSYEIILTHLFAPISIASNQVRSAQTEAILSWIEDLPADISTIVAGPLFLGHHTSARKKFEEQANLQDASKGLGWVPTWPKQTNFTKTVADHLFTSKNVGPILKYKTGPFIDSEHRGIIVDISTK